MERAGLTMNDAVRMTVFLKNDADFPRINKVYKGFSLKTPTRTNVEVNLVSPGILVTIDAIAYRD